MSAEQNTRSSGNSTGQPARNAGRPALDVRAPVLTQPFKGLVETGIIASIAVEFSPLGTKVSGKASRALAEVEDSGLNTTDNFPVGKLLAVAEAAGFTRRPGSKKGAEAQQAKPAKSLVPTDLDLSPAALQQRANEVARACGGGPLVGRVRSAGRFRGTETTSYQDWWKKASASDRLLSLTEGKRRGEFPSSNGGLKKIAELQCPFRGTLEFVVSAGDEDEG